jgi:hypothetical protein
MLSRPHLQDQQPGAVVGLFVTQVRLGSADFHHGRRRRLLHHELPLNACYATHRP